MTDRLPVMTTSKLFSGGAFPRSESGRVVEVEGANVALASRKDVRDAVKAARGAFPKWSAATAYNRGQVLYRLAEIMEARAGDLAAACSGPDEVARAVDRVVWYAGWTDKGSRILAMVQRLRAGVVWANTFNRFDPTSPFGGYKESGYGREGGRHGLEAYLT